MNNHCVVNTHPVNAQPVVNGKEKGNVKGEVFTVNNPSGGSLSVLFRLFGILKSW